MNDITYCVNKECKNKNCERNIKNAPKDMEYVSFADFTTYCYCKDNSKEIDCKMY